MEVKIYELPRYWISRTILVSERVAEEASNRLRPCPKTIGNFARCHGSILGQYVCDHSGSQNRWHIELRYTKLVWSLTPLGIDILDVLGCILSRFCNIPASCPREHLPGTGHDFLFFTDYHTIQIFCAHDDTELQEFQRLIHIDLDLRRSKRSSKIDQEAITKIARCASESVQKYLIWETSFFDPLDMEALSPRDVNAHMRAKPAPQKPAHPPAKLGRERDHPPPPPAEVPEPPCSDRKNGSIYKTGRCLGKGGFAICYEAQLKGTKKKYALKIVKSHMSQKKMEQKVHQLACIYFHEANP
jgi:hypothetical protein